jgi:hypothetical protein
MALTNGKLISAAGSGAIKARSGLGELISRSADGWGLISSAAGLQGGAQYLVMADMSLREFVLHADDVGKSTQGWGISSRSGAGRLISEGK